MTEKRFHIKRSNSHKKLNFNVAYSCSYRIKTTDSLSGLFKIKTMKVSEGERRSTAPLEKEAPTGLWSVQQGEWTREKESRWILLSEESERSVSCTAAVQ